MFFSMKITLKNNNNHTPNHGLDINIGGGPQGRHQFCPRQAFHFSMGRILSNHVSREFYGPSRVNPRPGLLVFCGPLISWLPTMCS